MLKLITSLVPLVLLTHIHSVAAAMPTRSECTIGYHLDWSNTTEDRRDVVNSIALVNTTSRAEHLAAMHIGPHQVNLYMVFKRHCEKKEEMALEQISIWQSHGLALPEFERIDDPIVLSPDTVDVHGPYWRDGQQNDTPTIDPDAKPQDL